MKHLALHSYPLSEACQSKALLAGFTLVSFTTLNKRMEKVGFHLGDKEWVKGDTCIARFSTYNSTIRLTDLISQNIVAVDGHFTEHSRRKLSARFQILRRQANGIKLFNPVSQNYQFRQSIETMDVNGYMQESLRSPKYIEELT